MYSPLAMQTLLSTLLCDRPSALMKMIVDQLRHMLGNTVDLDQVLDRGAADRLGGAEGVKQRVTLTTSSLPP